VFARPAVSDRGGNTNSDDDDTFTVRRLRGSGTPDPTWNGDGEARTNINPGVGGFEQATAVGLGNDGSEGLGRGLGVTPGRRPMSPTPPRFAAGYAARSVRRRIHADGSPGTCGRRHRRRSRSAQRR
jgi:hypothetical protein